jgi:hypothetical protein
MYVCMYVCKVRKYDNSKGINVCMYVCMYVCMNELGGNRSTRLGNEDGGVSAIGAGAAVELPARATHRQTPSGHGPDQLIVPFILIRAATHLKFYF